MTTAHRPTWNAVQGGKDQGGNRILVPSRQYSSKDLPGHTILKERKKGQGNPEELKSVDFKAQLLQKEKEYFLEKSKFEENPQSEEESEGDIEQEESESYENQSEEESSEDEEALRAEIEKIKAERAEAERKRKEQEDIERQKARREEILNGNPLLDIAQGYQLKRKWTEETMFRNQARGEPKEKQRFINDTVRSDLHKKILKRYIY
ncbi:unnamed protein product [Blepharisma stoltei]|uniref:Cwf15/Cwc15 cell cycle control protein n=1 Tax=Blepharisma stoltei TaxID=1481888 RepID=A0AAU9K603_9CILI|nr:unnamed protein product [Blepharisma stoltei]